MQVVSDHVNLMAKIQSFLLSFGWIEKQTDFFHALAPFLAEVLKADYICIDKLHGNLEAETIAVWYDGQFEDNYSYTLADTPCGQVLNNDVCTVPERVRYLFPKDKFLQEMGAESYSGITLRDSYGRPAGLIAVISRTPAGDMDTVQEVLRLIAIRASAELEHRKTVRSFEGLALAAGVIVAATDITYTSTGDTAAYEKSLMQQVCKIIIEYCDFSLMWIGLSNDDEAKTITPVASAGFEEGYLERLNLTYADTERGRGPSGTAVRTGKPFVCHNIQEDPIFAPWRKDAIVRGYASNLAVPMIANGKVIGLVSVYARAPFYFRQQELQLVTRFTNDLSAGIMSIRLKAEREKMLFELHMANELLEVTVSERTAILTDTNRKLKEEIEIRKKNEKLLRHTEQKYRTVADFAYEAESWLGIDGGFIYVSPSFERITGYAAEEFLKDSSLYYKISHPDDLPMVENHFNHILFPNDDTCSLQYRIITKSGDVKWIGHTCHPVYNADGEWIGQRGSNRDITAEKQFEETLLKSQKQLRALTMRLDEIAENERKTVARYIHDELGHLLTALKFDIDNIATNKERAIADLATEFESVNKLIYSLINAVRKIATDLRPEIIDHLGLIAALEWQIKEFRKRTRLCCIYQMDEIAHPFSPKETTVIYRIMQEVLTNIARHAEAKHVRIFVIAKEDELMMRISDNGKGFIPENHVDETSLGLLGMRERAMSIGGKLTIESSPGKGTQVTFRLPMVVQI